MWQGNGWGLAVLIAYPLLVPSHGVFPSWSSSGEPVSLHSSVVRSITRAEEVGQGCRMGASPASPLVPPGITVTSTNLSQMFGSLKTRAPAQHRATSWSMDATRPLHQVTSKDGRSTRSNVAKPRVVFQPNRAL